MKKIDLIGMDEDYLLGDLGEVKMFSYLTDPQKREVLRFAEVIAYDKGEKIISQGEVTPYLYAVLQGQVSVLKFRDGKKCKV